MRSENRNTSAVDNTLCLNGSFLGVNSRYLSASKHCRFGANSRHDTIFDDSSALSFGGTSKRSAKSSRIDDTIFWTVILLYYNEILMNIRFVN